MIKLYKGDCLIESDKIESGSVDLILTDLPYGTVKNIKNVNHGMSGKCDWDIIIDTNKIMEVANRILRKNGKMILTAQQPFTNELINKAHKNVPFNYSMIWEKDHFANALTAKKAPLNYYEDVLVFSKNNPKNDVYENPLRDYFNKQRQIIKHLSYKEINRDYLKTTFEGGGGMAYNILASFTKGWTFPTEKRYNSLKVLGICLTPYEELKNIDEVFRNKMHVEENEKYPSTFNLWQGNKYKSNILKYKKDYTGHHPTQKPVLLLEDLIKTFSNENDLVVDLTMGSGSTLVACQNTNRNGIGIEMNEDYFQIATDRVGAFLQ